MRSSYYSDRRFKRGSLAHELCSKIEVTIEKEATSSTQVFVPFLSHPLYPLLNSSLVGFALCSYGGKLILLLFRRYIFSSEENLPPAPLAPPALLLLLLLSSSPRFSISHFNPVRSAESNSQNLLLGISWIIINAYAVAGGINHRVILLLFPVLSFSSSSSFPFAAIGWLRYVRFEKTTTTTA